MEPEFSDHARARMIERRISENQVRNTLNNPDRTYPGRGGRTIAERETEAGNTLRVIYIDRPEGPLIVSVLRIGARGSNQ